MIVDIHHVPGYSWGEKCEGWPLVDSGELSVKQERMPGGTAERLHRHHQARQFFYVLRGKADFELDGQTYTLGVGQGIQVEASSKHRILNRLADPLDFLVISQPPTSADREDLD